MSALFSWPALSHYNCSMALNPQVVEAQLAVNRISPTEMPRPAWEAMEAGLDGPAIRRLAALEFPIFFQVQQVLPRAMKAMHLLNLDKTTAALRLAGMRAKEMLASNVDPLRHLRDFELLWIEAGYCRELSEVGSLADQVYVAPSCGEPEPKIHEWLMERLRSFAVEAPSESLPGPVAAICSPISDIHSRSRFKLSAVDCKLLPAHD
jgi:hypothetical protein